jgi:hypothetical protein
MYRQPRSGFTRIPYVQNCRVRVDGQERTGLLCNVSVLGVYLHLEPRPDVGTAVEIEFALPDGDPPLAARAVVTWVNDAPPDRVEELPQGCGLRFTALAPAEVRRLSALVSGFVAAPHPLPGRAEARAEKVRIPYVAPCILSTLDGPRRANVCNLSRDGVYVSVDPPPEPGAAVIVAFRLPGLEEAFERVAVVAWRNPEGPGRVHALPPGCGLRFAGLSEGDAARLTALVDEYAGALPAPAQGTG